MMIDYVIISIEVLFRLHGCPSGLSGCLVTAAAQSAMVSNLAQENYFCDPQNCCMMQLHVCKVPWNIRLNH